jgi:K+-sensing histidine kinase KdpD
MSPGVGKTYAMLAAAQRMAAQGVDVAVGVVETHGRAETEQMLLGLDIMPRVKIEYGARGRDHAARVRCGRGDPAAARHSACG